MARTAYAEPGHNAANHHESAASSGFSSTNDVKMQTMLPRTEPFPGNPSGNVEPGDNDIGVQAIGALLSASFGS